MYTKEYNTSFWIRIMILSTVQNIIVSLAFSVYTKFAMSDNLYLFSVQFDFKRIGDRNVSFIFQLSFILLTGQLVNPSASLLKH